MPNTIENPQLTIISGDNQRCVTLNMGRTTIGRKSENAVVISDPSVSGFHAAITIDENKVFIEDLGSTNGTFIEGVKIDMPYRLKDNTSILLGMSNLVFTMNRKLIKEVPFAPAVAEDEPKSMTIQPSDYKSTRASIDPQPCLEFLADDLSVTKRLVLDKTVNPLGRLGVGVAAISYGRNGWVLSPVDGLAPLLNGAAVTTTTALLKDGDMIVLGDLQARFVA
ncbi:MAG: FHA domain-containing protein [Saezia sp.]